MSPKAKTEPAAKPEVTPEDTAAREAAVATFTQIVTDAVAGRDTSTGTLSVESNEAVKSSYRSLDTKAKNAARKVLTENIFAAMRAEPLDVGLAKAYTLLQDEVTAPAPKAPKVKTPVNPAEARILQVASVTLAYQLLMQSALPEGVSADEVTEGANALISALPSDDVDAYQQYLDTPADTRPAEAPKLPAFAMTAVKILNGKSAKVKSGKSGEPYTGQRRSIENHVVEAFDAHESGAFLKISDIVNFKSAEYGDDHPSSGAVSGYLFDKAGTERTHAKISGSKDSENHRGGVKN